MISSLLLFSFLTVAAPPIPTTWVVDQGGAGDFITIQDAINASSAGDFIVVHAGTFVEDLIIPVSVTITGAAGDTTLIQPATSNPGIGTGGQILTTTQCCRIEADDVVLQSLVFDGNNPALGSGIDARNGIVLNDAAGAWQRLTVDGCSVRNVWYRGIYLTTGGSHSILNNFVENAKMVPLDSSGIFFYGSNGTAIGNTVLDCGIGVATHAGSSGELASNDIRNCGLGVLANGENAASTIHDNYLEGNTQGIQLIGLFADVTVHHNTIVDSMWAISFYGSTAQGLIEDNVLIGSGITRDTGFYASTDLAPWGQNDILGHLARNEFRDFSQAILLEETAASKFRLMAPVIGGDAASINTFSGSTPWNIQLLGCDDNINASWNSWGFATAPLIGHTVYDQLDNAALGLVDISNPVTDRVLVAANGSGDYMTIQEGIDNVAPGGTITVRGGDYVGSLIIPKSLVLVGNGTDPVLGTNIFGDNPAPGVGNDVVTVLAAGVTIRNLRVDAWSSTFGARFGSGIIYDNTSAGSVSNVRVEHATYGIYAYYSSAMDIQSCEVIDCSVDLTLGGGIFFRGATGTIGSDTTGNLAQDCGGVGIVMQGGSAGTVEGNLAKNCGVGYLSNGASAYTLFRHNGATASTQGFQGIGNNAPVDFIDNTVIGGVGGIGFSLFGIGGQPYLYRGNSADGVGTGSTGLYVNPNTQWGSSDIHAVFRDNSFANYNYGVELDETGGNTFLLDLDFNGSGGEQNRICGNNIFAVILSNCDDSVLMPQTYWGTTDLNQVENRIFHHNDNLALGLVDFSLPLAPTPDLRADSIYLTTGRKVQFLITGNPGDPFWIAGGDTPGVWNTPFGALGLSQGRSRLVIHDFIPASGLFVSRIETGATDPGTYLSQGGVGGSLGTLTGIETFDLH